MDAGDVFVLAPVPGDADAVRGVLAREGYRIRVCQDMRELARSLDPAAGTVVLTEEALHGSVSVLQRALAQQPNWSDVPVILLAGIGGNGDTAWSLAQELESVGNITILERPLRRSTLLAAVRVAFRARARQQELRAYKDDLEALVAERTDALEESMRQLGNRERLASLGTLATGLGHDLANLLLPIRMHLDSLARATVASRSVHGDIEAIGTSLGYLSNLSAGLRLLALDPERDAASHEIDDLLWWWAQVHGVLRACLPKHLKLVDDLPSGVGVGMTAHQLTQAVFNLIQNAGEALGDQADGQVQVTADVVDRGSDRRVILRVADNGPGMSDEVAARCFEPYFSTKGRAIATGMGLGLVRGLVEKAGGSVTLETAPGAGACFTLDLPRKTASASPTVTATRAQRAALSVQDPRLAAIAAMLLEGLGLEVVRSAEVPPTAAIWVAQAPAAGAIATFLDANPHSQIVILGGGPTAAAAVARVTALPAGAPPSAIREALVTARWAMGDHREAGP